MNFKKIFFYLIFLFFFSTLIYQLSSMLIPNYLFFSFSLEIITQFLFLSSLIFLTGISFILFISLANDWKISFLGILASIFLSFIFLPITLAIVFSASSFLAFLLIYFLLSIKLKKYINFNSLTFFNFSLNGFLFLFTVISSLIYFLFVNSQILEKGFKIPEPLITAAADATSEIVLPESVNKNLNTLNTIGQSALVLQSLGLGNQDLGLIGGTINESANITKALSNQGIIRDSIEAQITKLLMPYYQFLEVILAILFFLTLQFILWVFSLFTPLVFLVLFFILEKTGAIKFVTETHKVKKIVM